MLFQDNSLSIGRTPLIKLTRVTAGAGATVLAKIEGRNPAYSVKDRIGAAMIWDAEKRGMLGPGKELIEPTSGNTGIALAFVAAARGYPITLIMPETFSVERRRILRGFRRHADPHRRSRGDARLYLEGGGDGGFGSRPLRSVSAVPESANPEIHFKTTGPEIWEDTAGAIDVLVAGVGTGGTITGVSRYIKNVQKKKILSVAVEPVGSPVISQTLQHQPLKPGPHKIQGIGAGFIPGTLDIGMVDRVVLVTNEESIEMARRLAREEGILFGNLVRGGRGGGDSDRSGARDGGQDNCHDSAGFRRTVFEYSAV